MGLVTTKKDEHKDIAEIRPSAREGSGAAGGAGGAGGAATRRSTECEAASSAEGETRPSPARVCLYFIILDRMI